MTSKFFTTLAAATTLAGIVTTAGAANAASLTQTLPKTFNYKPSDPDVKVLDGGYVATDIIDDIISVEKFNSALGTLKSVTIDFSTDLLGDAKFENRSRNSTTVLVDLSGKISLKLNNNIDLFSSTPTQSYTYQVARFDGKTDFEGTSGKAVNGLTATLSQKPKTITDSNYLKYFVGAGNLDLLFSGLANSTVTGSGNMSSEINTYVKAGVTVTYDYEPKSVPEPSAVLGIGLAGVGIFLQTRKNRLKTSNS